MTLSEFSQTDIEGTVAIIVVISQSLGRVIPDHWGGLLGFIRRLAKVIGLYNGYGGKPRGNSLPPIDEEPSGSLGESWECPTDCPNRT